MLTIERSTTLSLPPGLAGIELPELGDPIRGKVRDCYILGDSRLLIASDRVSAFDHVLNGLIPGKGAILTQLSRFFLEKAENVVPTHFIGCPDPAVMLAHQADALPIEVVVRGYLTGSAWRDYAEGVFEEKYGFALPEGLERNARLPHPIITPTSKEAHDRPLTPREVKALAGGEQAWKEIEKTALALFEQGSRWAQGRNLILVDTKYEFGRFKGQLMLIDEVHTPDSSRYWDADDYRKTPLSPQPWSKEILRQWLLEQGWTGDQLDAPLPEALKQKLLRCYEGLFERLTGQMAPQIAGEDPENRVVRALTDAGLIAGGMVMVICGSTSDDAVARPVLSALAKAGVPHRLVVASAHKVPEKIFDLAQRTNQSSEPMVFVTIAGRSNGLSATFAANSVHPVIALPAFQDVSDYHVNIHSSLQLPKDTPSLTVIDPGNAAQAAIRILGISQPKWRQYTREAIAAVKATYEV